MTHAVMDCAGSRRGRFLEGLLTRLLPHGGLLVFFGLVGFSCVGVGLLALLAKMPIAAASP